MGNHRSPYATKVGESQFGDSHGSEKEDEIILRSIKKWMLPKNRGGPPTWMVKIMENPHG